MMTSEEDSIYRFPCGGICEVAYPIAELFDCKEKECVTDRRIYCRNCAEVIHNEKSHQFVAIYRNHCDEKEDDGISDEDTGTEIQSLLCADTDKAVVIDNGSGTIKAGFAGCDAPQLVFPSLYHPKAAWNACAAIQYNGQCYDKSQLRPKTKSQHPIECGVITNWKHMESVWDNTFKQLNVESCVHSILLTEAILTPKANKEKMTQIMFEDFDVRKFYVAIDSVLALYASGRTTGIVLNSGYGITNITPIYEGFALPHAVQRLQMAGQHITEYLKKMLTYEQNVYSLDTSSVIDIKEKLCYVARNYDDEMKQCETVTYHLPDGGCLQIGNERLIATESLFQPKLLPNILNELKMIEYNKDGIHKLTYSSIMKCDVAIRNVLYNNIVMSGGSTMFEGMVQRFQKEVSVLAPESTIKVIAPPERKQSVWIGGAILAAVSTFEEMWITKEEYDESGPSIVHRKCA